MKQVLLIGLGGFLGSISRYGLSVLTQSTTYGSPLGTLLVNWGGSLFIGLVVGLSLKANHPLYWFLIIGFCGGFTTFSSFVLDNINLIKNDLWFTALSYSFLSMIVGCILCLIGIWIGDKVA